MLCIARLLTFLAVMLVMAQPVMACCLPGNGATHIDMLANAEPPCHGDGMGMETASDAPTLPMPGAGDCPGCLDCDSPVLQAQVFDNTPVQAPSVSEIPVVLRAVHVRAFAPATVILTTGPPGAPPQVPVTPLELKQRLLI